MVEFFGEGLEEGAEFFEVGLANFHEVFMGSVDGFYGFFSDFVWEFLELHGGEINGVGVDLEELIDA